MDKNMAQAISCPHCSRPVDPSALTCKHCGVDLAFAAVLAEQSVIAPLEIPEGVPLSPEVLVPRLGDILLEQGMLSIDELQQALVYQKERQVAGKPVLIGRALLDLELVNQETLDQVVTTQILQLQSALNNANRQLEQRVHERTLDLQRALDRLGELNQLKSNFIANISHELRTPLTHIKGYLDLLLDGGLGPLTQPQSDALDVIQRAEVRLERLIEDLIHFSLVSKAELSLNLDQVYVKNLLRNVVNRAHSKAQMKGVDLRASVAENLPPAKVDQEKLGWVISQLLDNAIKFTPAGGIVEISVREKLGRINVAIRDTGIGIPEDRLEEIFEPFHQLDSSATRRYGGTGLGLSMVRRIIEAHGAQIQVHSKVDQGSQFEFSLPVIKELEVS
jgi:signal transduction histidine kinase